MDWFKLAYTLLGGLGIFFFGMKSLSEGLQALASQWIRQAINTLTSNRFIAVIVGLFITCFVQSSSITTVMVIGFVNAGLMELSQAIGVIFGANIGTTITGWIISIKVGKYSLLFIGLGIFPFLFAKNERFQQLGKLLFALGMVFLGLTLMGDAFKPLRSNADFLQLMQYFSADNYLSLIATVSIGCLLTFLVQSSSAMLGITIALAMTSSISFQTALALVLGENIGTTITAILASIGANTSAKRASAAHALFNVLGVIVIVSIFWPYKNFIESIVSHSADFIDSDGQKPYIAAHIAAGHTFFNVANVLLFLPFTKVLEKIIVKLIPDKKYKEQKKLEFFGSISITSPVLAISQARAELIKMSHIVKDIFENTNKYLNEQEDQKNFEHINKYEHITDKIQMEIMIFLGKVMESRLTAEETNRIKSILRMADELESIADYCASIAKYSQRSYKENFKFDEDTKKELLSISQQCFELFESLRHKIEILDELDKNKLMQEWNDFNSAADKLKETHLNRISEGKFPPVANLTLSDIIVSFRRIKNHTVNLAEAYMGEK